MTDATFRARLAAAEGERDRARLDARDHDKAEAGWAEQRELATTATARVAELEGALKDGFMTTTSGGGANPYVKITFATIVEMQRCHLALLHIGTARALTNRKRPT